MRWESEEVALAGWLRGGGDATNHAKTDNFHCPMPLHPITETNLKIADHPRRQVTVTCDKTLQNSPPPPPSKRHCRSLSVPEDLSRCRASWHPSAFRVWTPIKRTCHSGEASMSGSGARVVPPCDPSSSITSSSLNSSSSPTFFSLALSDSPLPWSFSWDPCDTLKGTCSASFAAPSSCSSSPAPLISHSLLQRRFSLSPVQIQSTSVILQPPQPFPVSSIAYGCAGMEQPAMSPSPTSVCSTPPSSRCNLYPVLPRCHSQPCDMRRPLLKRRHDQDIVSSARPGLDFGKMTQVKKPHLQYTAAQHSNFSPVELLGRVSIGPLSESEEDKRKNDGGQTVFERDCTELDINLIEEN
uniref:Family with sequence similarity 53 member C n=1 Tax=Neogobius melanostomus TaxID=47308 RepID=A0A8C6UZA3_9GOBI